jgi:hypothetical protein
VQRPPTRGAAPNDAQGYDFFQLPRDSSGAIRWSELRSSRLLASPERKCRMKSLRQPSAGRSPLIGKPAPPTQCHQTPNGFYQAERPRSLKEAVNGAQETGKRERQNKSRATMLQSIKNEHGCNRDYSKRRERIHGINSNKEFRIRQCRSSFGRVSQLQSATSLQRK